MFKCRLLRYILLFLIGGFCYCIIENVARGHSHISMLIDGGICFLLIGGLNSRRRDMSLVSQMFLSMIIITVVEFVTGLIVNIWLKLGVWDYSLVPYNFMGQICLLYSNLWFLLSLVAIILDDVIKYLILGGDKPNYKIL